MREILFRGKQIDNGKWIEGFLVKWGEDYYIAPYINSYTSKGGREKGNRLLFGDFYEVDPATVGQYTGLTDENGKKIFEGDLVTVYGSNPHCVKYAEGTFYMTGTAVPIKAAIMFKVIGNIFDNSKLIEDKP